MESWKRRSLLESIILRFHAGFQGYRFPWSLSGLLRRLVLKDATWLEERRRSPPLVGRLADSVRKGNHKIPPSWQEHGLEQNNHATIFWNSWWFRKFCFIFSTIFLWKIAWMVKDRFSCWLGSTPCFRVSSMGPSLLNGSGIIELCCQWLRKF